MSWWRLLLGYVFHDPVGNSGGVNNKQSQIGMHGKPIVVFNVDGFFDNFLRMVDGFVQEGFVDADTRGIVKVATTAEEVIAAIEGYVLPGGRMKLDWGDGVKGKVNGVSVEEALA
jgi:hypothetical protein